MKQPYTHYTVIADGRYPLSCLPTGMDTSNLMDITRTGDSFRRYFNPVTGEEHDGAKYWADYQASLKDESPMTAKQCPCGDRPAEGCPGEWEPGCDLGANEHYVATAGVKLELGGEGLQPIETAPRDSSYILVGNAGGWWVAKWWPVARSGFRFHQPWFSMMLNHDHITESYQNLPPTHWMPLPALPGQGKPVQELLIAQHTKYAALMLVVEHILDDGHMDTMLLAQLRAAWEGVTG